MPPIRTLRKLPFQEYSIEYHTKFIKNLQCLLQSEVVELNSRNFCMQGNLRQKGTAMANPKENETPGANVSDEEKQKQEAERRRREFEEKLKQEQYQRDDM